MFISFLYAPVKIDIKSLLKSDFKSKGKNKLGLKLKKNLSLKYINLISSLKMKTVITWKFGKKKVV